MILNIFLSFLSIAFPLLPVIVWLIEEDKHSSRVRYSIIGSLVGIALRIILILSGVIIQTIFHIIMYSKLL